MKHVAALLALFFALNCKPESKANDGVIVLMKGSALIEHVEADGTKKTRAAKVGEKITVGDTIVTAIDGTVVFDTGEAKFEIQHNARFAYEKAGADTQVYVQSGNVWTEVSKREAGKHFTLRTPTTIAAVRGTKFYTFTDGKTTGTCHCEGQIALKDTLTGVEEYNDGDYLKYFRDKKSIRVKLSDLERLGVHANHDHSEIDKSPLGKKSTMTAEQASKVNADIDRRFAALR